jgi:hypothetical protein
MEFQQQLQGFKCYRVNLSSSTCTSMRYLTDYFWIETWYFTAALQFNQNFKVICASKSSMTTKGIFKLVVSAEHTVWIFSYWTVCYTMIFYERIFYLLLETFHFIGCNRAQQNEWGHIMYIVFNFYSQHWCALRWGQTVNMTHTRTKSTSLFIQSLTCFSEWRIEALWLRLTAAVVRLNRYAKPLQLHIY